MARSNSVQNVEARSLFADSRTWETSVTDLGLARRRQLSAVNENRDPITSDQQSADARSYSKRFRRSLSPEIIGGTAKTSDFCLILVAAVAAFAVYHVITVRSVAEPERHMLTALVAATLFVAAMQYMRGYT